jgi:RNA polymerase sigma-70 factor (ECF subfamily)
MTIALWRSFERYDASRPFATWAYRIVLNVAISFFRSESRHAGRLSSLDADRALDPVSENPRVDALLECIGELGALDKALVLMYLDGYAHAEIAGVLGITSTNAATKLARIKQRLHTAVTAREKRVTI